MKTFITQANNPKSINYKLEKNKKMSHKCLQIYWKTRSSQWNSLSHGHHHITRVLCLLMSTSRCLATTPTNHN